VGEANVSGSTQFFGGIVGKTMGGQESMGSDAQGSMMVEASRVATFLMRQAKLLFEFPAITLDTPAQSGAWW
jgi:hypothetical protein